MPDRWLYGWSLGDVAVGAASPLFPLQALAIGGVPLSFGPTFEVRAPIESEGEAVYDGRTSLRNDVEAAATIETLGDHVALADDLGDHTTEELLREHLGALEELAHPLEHYLEDDTLVLESATK